MSDERSHSTDTLLLLLVGVAIGAAAGLLFAPRPGKETRRRVRQWIDDVEDDLQDEDLHSLWTKGKDALREKAGEVKDRVEAAVREKAGEVRGRVEAAVREKADALKSKVREVLGDDPSSR